MKPRIALALVAAAFAAAISTATPAPATDKGSQPLKPPATPAELHRRVQAARVAQQLALTGEQRTKIRDLRQASAATLKGIRTDKTLTDEQRKTKLRETSMAGRKQVLDVLTPVQRAKLEKIRQRLLAPLGPLS